MLKPLLTRLLQHLIDQNAWARAQLQPYGGRSVRLDMPPLGATLAILEDGGLAMAGETATADAGIRLAPTVAFRLLSGDQAAATLVTLEGDTELAAALGRVLRGMRWEYEEDLSRLIGDAPAHQLADFGRRAAAGVGTQLADIARMLAEYWQEEQPMIAKKRHVSAFVQEVDELRDAAARLEKRIEQLTLKTTPKDSE